MSRGRGTLTPLDKKYKTIITNNLIEISRKKGMRQADIVRASGLAKSTINGYFKGTSLPTTTNTIKLAKSLNVSPTEIDPRFKTTSNEETNVAHIDLKKDPVVLSYDGQPATQDDMDFIKMILKRRKEKNEH